MLCGMGVLWLLYIGLGWQGEWTGGFNASGQSAASTLPVTWEMKRRRHRLMEG
jgi:hypothetical protein